MRVKVASLVSLAFLSRAKHVKQCQVTIVIMKRDREGIFFPISVISFSKFYHLLLSRKADHANYKYYERREAYERREQYESVLIFNRKRKCCFLVKIKIIYIEIEIQ